MIGTYCVKQLSKLIAELYGNNCGEVVAPIVYLDDWNRVSLFNSLVYCLLTKMYSLSDRPVTKRIGFWSVRLTKILKSR